MLDELEQRQQRLESLNEKLRKIKEDQGLFFSSIISCFYNYIITYYLAKKVQSLFDSLEITNDSVYCNRVREMYSSEPLRTHLLMITLKQTRLLFMADPSILGQENVVNHLKEIDHIR